MPFWIAVAALCLLLGGANAHPGHDDASQWRLWKEMDGTEIEASLLLARDGQVHLRQSNGALVSLPIGQLSSEDRGWVESRLDEIRRINAAPMATLAEVADDRAAAICCSDKSALALGTLALLAAFVLHGSRRPGAMRLAMPMIALLGPVSLLAIAHAWEDKKATPIALKHFEPFQKSLELRTDDDYLYVGSSGFPDHPMMVGIKAWQQQVPLPQPFTGKNAWQIPLKPKLAEKPISAKNALFRGAIALAINGVPIFNALNNRGEDAFLIGELDEYGGHCGRGDDYHYHAAPVHLEKIAGKGNPIGYALDGFPLYGYTDADGQEPKNLDEFNGRMEADGYRYYSTKKYPYINGGMRGVVTVKGDQVDPQPREAPVRPAGTPLRGAKITDFVRDDDKQTYTVKYEVQSKPLSVKYTINKDGTYDFVYTDRTGKETAETYRRRERKEPKKDGPPPKKDN